MNNIPSKTVKVLVVDNEEAGRRKLAALLQSYPWIQILDEAEDGLKALEKIHKLRPDVVFLDIEMPHLNGIEVARNIEGKKPLIIFVTAFDTYAIEAFEIHAVDYLLKPITEQRIQKSVDRIAESTGGSAPFAYERFVAHKDSLRAGRKICVNDGKDMVIIPMDDISLITMESRYVHIFYQDKDILLTDSLTNIANRLDASCFLSIHRNAMVNMSYVLGIKRRGLRQYNVVLGPPLQRELPISRARLEAVRDWLTGCGKHNN